MIPQAQIFLMTYNRPHWFLGALESLMNQKNISYEIVISDNSSTDVVGTIFSRSTYTSFENVRYIRRYPSLPVLEHSNVITNEVTAPYFMVFHDDDILYPHALKTLWEAMEASPDLVAVGANANVIGTNTPRVFSPNMQNKVVRSPEELAMTYLRREGGHAPFPIYLYRTSLAKREQLSEEDGGKHADVTYLIKLLKWGPIQWINTPLMDYRIHGGNGSATIDLEATNKLCDFLSHNTVLPKTDIQGFRTKTFIKYLFQNPMHLKKIISNPIYRHQLGDSLKFGIKYPNLLLK